MRKFERVEIEGEVDVVLSSVPWGPFRRWNARRKARSFGIRLQFIPKYELAVCRRHPARTLPGMPEIVFRFRDRNTAIDGYHRSCTSSHERRLSGRGARRLEACLQ
jgi:hypothetical protein